jgi:beta-adrenergic-receptor kinase
LKHVQRLIMKKDTRPNIFQPYVEEIYEQLRGETFQKFIDRYNW